MKPILILSSVLAAIPAIAATTAPAPGGGDSMGDIAQKLNNPVASLISVPFQNNWDFGGGPDDDGYQYKMNFQPVVPIGLGEDWNVIWRTIVPFIDEQDRFGTGSETGLGDTTASFFFSPTQNEPGKPIWGIGPDFLLPTATNDLLGSKQWGAGPTGLFLIQNCGWTTGMLASHIWSLWGDNDREYVSNTFLQPFLSYTTPQHTTVGANFEASYDWNHEDWTVPINLFVTQLVKFGDVPVSFQLGGRYYFDKPDGGPDWGLRFGITFVLPK